MRTESLFLSLTIQIYSVSLYLKKSTQKPMKQGKVLRNIVFVLIILCSCTNNESKKAAEVDARLNDTMTRDTGYFQKARYIFYNLYSPIEMSQLFTSIGANYKSDLINPVSNRDKYNTSIQVALNLGIYGVDFSYLRMFKQDQVSLEYLFCIQQLSQQLGIPRDVVSFTTANIEKNITDKDSVLSVANDAFRSADIYLKGNERQNIAAYIMLGGWIESLYITLNMYKNPEIEIINRVAEQKYSLKSLIQLLSNIQQENELDNYIAMLKKLYNALNQLSMGYDIAGEPEIDTIAKKISLSGKRLDVINEQVREVRYILERIRAQMTS